MRRPFPIISAVALGILALVGVGTWVAGWARLRSDLESARLEAASGRYARARAILCRRELQERGWAEVEYLLGVCERGLGHPEAAEAAWSRVASGSWFAGRARLARADVLVEGLGRLAAAEPLLDDLVRGGGVAAGLARPRLARLLFWQGRAGEARDVLEGGWATDTDRASVLRDLWAIDHDPTTEETVRSVLERAAARAPDDDRVWLGRANLAMRSGQLDEAARWLALCLQRRPEDPPVWQARLEWARARGRIEEVGRALRHLPDDRLSPEAILAQWAWSAACRGDAEVERRALEALVEREPGASGAWERLAVLVAQAGSTAHAADLRRRKGEADRSWARYRRLLEVPAPASIVVRKELAQVAEALGRWFEARGWWALAEVSAEARQKAFDRLDRHRPSGTHAAGWTPAGLRTYTDTGNLPGSAPPRTTGTPVALADFEDRTEAAGLRFTYDPGRSTARQLPETMGGGVGLLDYDGDGWLDVYCVQGGPFPPDPHPSAGRDEHGDRLFHNRGDGTFEDDSERSGIAGMARGYGHGVAVGDIDNDGHPDLFVTRWREYALYRNRGDGTFEDVTERWGLGGDRDWPTSAAFADLDGDGDLDLYVCHYLAWDTDSPPSCGSAPAAPRTYCDPRTLKALPDHLFRNEGTRFRDVTAAAGIVGTDGRALGVVAADLDDDGDTDLFVANDSTANSFWRNLGGMRFEEVGERTGVASAATGGYQAGMGVAAGDLDNDGRTDLVVTNFYGESTTFYRNLDGTLFTDQSAAVGLAAPSRSLLGFGIVLADLNNDGRLDLATANGHVNDFRPLVPYAMPAQLLVGTPDGRLIGASSRDAGPAPWNTPRVARGLAAGDLDNDGRVDLVFVSQGEPLAFLRNRTVGGHAVTLRLEGAGLNRDAVGARVVVTAGGRRQARWRIGGGSYLSASDPRLHFGLGANDRLEAMEVRWPSGRIDRFQDLPADRRYRLSEGMGANPSLLSSSRLGAEDH